MFCRRYMRQEPSFGALNAKNGHKTLKEGIKTLYEMNARVCYVLHFFLFLYFII